MQENFENLPHIFYIPTALKTVRVHFVSLNTLSPLGNVQTNENHLTFQYTLDEFNSL